MMIREATIDEAVAVLAKISEFAKPADHAAVALRLDGRRALVLVAEQEGELVGVKIGYALSEQVFYSWLGGVAPRGRGRGVAQALLEAQEEWAREQGYSAIRVKSRNRFPAMLRLLLRNGYLIEDMDKKEGVLDYRLHFSKQLVSGESIN